MPTTTIDLPEIAAELAEADVIDVKTYRGQVPLREFTAGALTMDSRVAQGLFAVRAVFAKLLRLDTAQVPARVRLRPEDIGFTPGHPVSFFTVVRGEEDRYLLMVVKDNHLDGYLAIVTRPGGVIHVVTLVKYHRGVGKLYFTLIRPFHHVVVDRMARGGLRASFPPAE